jgi:RNA polymerase sigma factor (sigma-70 family)
MRYAATRVSLPRPLSENPSESELVSRIRAGDERAFEELFMSHWDALQAFVRGYLDRATTEEVIQELFLKIWQRRESWNPQCELRPYLFTAARNLALTLIRKRRTSDRAVERCAGEGISPGATHFNPDPAHDYSTAEIESACRRAIHDLPEARRLALTLRWQYGMSHAQIAFILGTTVKGVDAHVSRGLRTLARRLAWLRA